MNHSASSAFCKKTSSVFVRIVLHVFQICLALAVVIFPAHAAKNQVVVWSEDFENNDVANNDYVNLTNYVGLDPAGQKYTAHANWLPGAKTCNGLISAGKLNYTSTATGVAACSNNLGAWNSVQQLAFAFAKARTPTISDADAKKNYALTAFTQGGNPTAGLVQFQTSTNIALPSGTRFLMASIETAATSCAAPHPLLRLMLLNQNGVEIPLADPGQNEDACKNDSGVNYVNGDGTLNPAANKAPTPVINMSTGATESKLVFVSMKSSDKAVKYSGNSVGYRIKNDQSSGNGNDAAIDNPKILDVTPTVEKSFSSANIPLGANSTLVYTVTNTTDLLLKDGWSFSDALPPGLMVAGTPTTTCGSSSITAATGATTVSVTASLPLGVESCTISIPVTANAVGTYTSNTGNYTALNYLNADQPATLTVTAAADMRSVTQVPASASAGDTVTVRGTCTNYGPSVAVASTCTLSGLPGGAPAPTCIPAAPVSLAVGEFINCSSTFTAPGAGGSINVTTVADSTTFDPNLTNNSSTGSFTVDPRSDMVAQVTGFPSTALAGVPVTGTVTCTNAGPSIATNASCGVATSSSTGVVVSCPAYPITLAVGASTSCSVTYTPPGTGAASLTVTGTASSANVDPVPGNNQSAQSIGVVPQADMQAVTSVPASVNAGQSTTVSGTCTNLGPSNANTPSCALSGLPSGVGQTCTPAPAPASLAVGAAITCTSNAFSAPASGTLNITTTAGTTTADPNGSNNVDTKGLTIVAQADMQVSIAGIPASVPAGSSVSGTVTCVNAGPSAASNASCSVSGLPAGAQVSCLPVPPLASLSVGNSIQCAVSYTAPLSGPLNIVGTASSTAADPNTANNTATAPQAVTPLVDMQASISVPSPLTAGQVATVTGICTNAGPSSAAAATCVLSGLPAGATTPVCVPASPVAALDAGSSITCTSTFTTPPAAPTAITVTAGTATAESNTSNNTASSTPLFVPLADMSVSLSGFPTTLAANQTITGTLTCANNGPSAAENVQCSAQSLPSGATVGACTPPSPSATLAAGTSISCPITYTAPSNPTVEVAITGVTSSTTRDPDPANNTMQVRLEATPIADIRSTTAISTSTANAGQSVTVTGHCRNYGPSLATSATCALSGLPSGAGQVCTPVPSPLPVYNPGLQPGDAGYGDGDITCVSSFTAPSSGSFTISTTGHSLTGDDMPANNTSSQPLTVTPQADMQVDLVGFPVTSVAAGSTVTGTMVCKNLGPSTAISATCTQTGLPATASVLCSPASPVASLDAGQELRCSVSFVAPVSSPITLTGKTSNTVADPNGANNEKILTLNVTESADMRAVLTLPASATAGQSVTVTGVCTNAGPSPAAAATCALSGLPAGATQTCTPVPPQLLTAAAPGNSISCSSSFVVPASGVLDITVTAASTTADPNSLNNKESKALTVSPVADMAVAMTGFPSQGVRGQSISGTVTCTNNGPSPAINARCSVGTVPADAVVICVPSTQPVSSLANGGSIVCSVQYTVPLAGGSSLEIEASTSSDVSDPVSANNVARQSIAFVTVAPVAIPIPQSLVYLLTLIFAGLAWAGRKYQWAGRRG